MTRRQNNYYSLKSYDHFCFFSNINNSKKKKDDFAFFVFFTFKGWKRLLLADAPRQVINGLTLYSFARSVHFSTNISDWYSGSFAKATVLITMIFTGASISPRSAVRPLTSGRAQWSSGSAASCSCSSPPSCTSPSSATSRATSRSTAATRSTRSVPLRPHASNRQLTRRTQRIAELMKRKTRKRLAKEAAIMRKEAMGDFSHLKDKKTGKMRGAPMPQPTLPQIGLDDLMDDGKSEYGGSRTGVGAGPGAYGYPPTLPYSNSAHALHPSQSMRWGGGEKEYGSEHYAESIASSVSPLALSARRSRLTRAGTGRTSSWPTRRRWPATTNTSTSSSRTTTSSGRRPGR